MADRRIGCVKKTAAMVSASRQESLPPMFARVALGRLVECRAARFVNRSPNKPPPASSSTHTVSTSVWMSTKNATKSPSPLEERPPGRDLALFSQERFSIATGPHPRVEAVGTQAAMETSRALQHERAKTGSDQTRSRSFECNQPIHHREDSERPWPLTGRVEPAANR